MRILQIIIQKLPKSLDDEQKADNKRERNQENDRYLLDQSFTSNHNHNLQQDQDQFSVPNALPALPLFDQSNQNNSSIHKPKSRSIICGLKFKKHNNLLYGTKTECKLS